MESEDFKNVFLTVLTKRIVWKMTQTLLLHKGGLSRDDFLGVLKVNLSRLTQQTTNGPFYAARHLTLNCFWLLSCICRVNKNNKTKEAFLAIDIHPSINFIS